MERTNMPEVDPNNSEQNAFVQEWLSRWADRFYTLESLADFYRLPPQHDALQTIWRQDKRENVIGATVEEIQGTYNYLDHQERIHGVTA